MLLHSKSHPASFTFHLFRAAALATALAVAPAAHAVLYWDANSNLAGTGTWDTTSTNWRTTNDVGPPNSVWTPNDGTQDAVFGGDPGQGTAGSGLGGPDGRVTVSGTVNVRSITLAAMDLAPPSTPAGLAHYSFQGGTINITDPTNSIVMQTIVGGAGRQQVIASPISGTDITVVANAVAGNVNSFLTLGGIPGTSPPAMAFTGDLIFGGTFAAGANGLHQININNPTALPTTAEVRMKRTQSQLLFTGGGPGGTTAYQHQFDNDIILNDSGGGTFTQGIGAQEIATVITLGGVISGDANLRFELGNGGGQGTIVLANNATYTGTTTINTGTSGLGTMRLGTDDALPVGTRLTVQRGRFDMGGFDQKVAGLSGVNGIITNTGSASTLTVDGNATGTHQGLIGAAATGHNDNIALVLASTHTGTLTLSYSLAFGNTYTGGTTINGGRLVVANDIITQPFSSATGTGPVAVNNGGILGGTGAVGGPITVASGGLIAPGLATGNTIGTLTAFNTVSLDSGSRMNIGLGAPAPGGGTSDRVNMSNIFGSFALTVPVAASSIGVNLSDPAGGAAGNGTYTLMSFQAGQYTGSNNASQFFTNSLPSPNSLNGATIAYHLADDSNTIQDGTPSAATRVIAIVSGGPNALLWTGASNGAWNTSTANFSNLATNTGTTFAGNDNVTFDDSGANTTPVLIAAGGVQPNIVTINNSTDTYTFSGGDIKGSSLGGGGGLFLGGTGPVTIDSNYTAAGPITSNKSGAGTATFNGNITAATSMTVNGGTVTLAGANTYTGANTVNGGTLTAQGTSANFGAGDLTVNAGKAVISAGVTDAILDTATLTLAGGGTANTADIGFIELGTGVDELVGSLVLGTNVFTSGTFGATGSSADNIMDEYFLGAGIITVGSVGLPGDHNNDGAVDAADYVAWRKNPSAFGGEPDGYDAWRENFGSTAGSGGSLPSAESQSPAVPEPTSSVLIALGILAMCPYPRGVVPKTR